MFNQETEKYFPARIFHSGEVRFNAPKILKTSCLLDVRYFPWDQQVKYIYQTEIQHFKNRINLFLLILR